MTNPTLRIAVGGQLRAHELADTVRTRLNDIHHDDQGAQAAEYAMLGGVSAAACGGLVAILSNTQILEKLVKAVVDTLVSAVGRWF